MEALSELSVVSTLLCVYLERIGWFRYCVLLHIVYKKVAKLKRTNVIMKQTCKVLFILNQMKSKKATQSIAVLSLWYWSVNIRGCIPVRVHGRLSSPLQRTILEGYCHNQHAWQADWWSQYTVICTRIDAPVCTMFYTNDFEVCTQLPEPLGTLNTNLYSLFLKYTHHHVTNIGTALHKSGNQSSIFFFLSFPLEKSHKAKLPQRTGSRHGILSARLAFLSSDASFNQNLVLWVFIWQKYLQTAWYFSIWSTDAS